MENLKITLPPFISQETEERFCLWCEKKIIPYTTHKTLRKFCPPTQEDREYRRGSLCARKYYSRERYLEIGKEENAKQAKEYRIKRNAKKLEENKNQEREVIFPDKPDMYAPFIKVREGFGYEGVILSDKKTGEVQCHVCGGYFHWLQNHIIGTHKMKAVEYREKFGLGYQTALCSEKVRESLVKRAMTFPWERMRKNTQKLIKAAKTGRSHVKNFNKGGQTMEHKNKLGHCSLQIIDRLEKVSKELGRIPYTQELTDERGHNMRGSIIKEFGSVAEVRRILEMRGHIYVPKNGSIKYTKEILLDVMKKFAEVYKRKPSYSDANRGILPSLSTYDRVFGSWSKAKMLAFGEKQI